MEIKNTQQFYDCVEKELFGNIVPFWTNRTIDRVNGGFYGRILNNLSIEAKAHKSLILNVRILWTFARLYRYRSEPQYLELAGRAYNYMRSCFHDERYGGMYWLVDYRGRVINDKKKIYGQAFAIYALAEYFSITGDQNVLDEAVAIFRLIEQYNYDKVHQGYLETSNRNWTIAEEMRLSEVDMNEMKSMNTHLHLMEAYTALYKVWPDEQLKEKLVELINVFQNHILDKSSMHFQLFFDEEWHSKSIAISFGHDIEGSWLLCEAAEALGDQDMIGKIRQTALEMARITADEGLSDHYTIFAEKNGNGKLYRESHWWQQAEAVVGFINAYETGGQEDFLKLAMNCWQAIENHFVDRQNGEWFYEIDAHGRPDMRRYKVSEWKGPYHSGRACLEVLERLKNSI